MVHRRGVSDKNLSTGVSPIFEELEQAGYIELADVYTWKRTNYDK